MEQRLIEKPVIYISYFLKKNQIEYYDRISEVRRTGNFEQWIRFFLEAVSKAASDSLEAIRQLSVLHDTNVENFQRQLGAKIIYEQFLTILNSIRLLISREPQRN